jgi:hypothetical protein
MALKPFVPVPRVLKVRLSGAITGAGAWAVLDWWRYSGNPPTVTDLNTFAAGIHTAYAGNIGPHFSTQVLLDKISVEDQTSTTAAVGFWEGSTPGAGATTGIPASTCLLESKSGAVRYRGGHSRSYWPILGDSGSIADNNQWSTAAVTAFAASLSTYLNAVISSGATLPFGPIQRSIVHYAPKTPVAGITYPYVEDVKASLCQSHFATQRRRLARQSN